MPSNLENMLHTQTRIRDKRAHQQLKYDLVEYIWKKFSRNQLLNFMFSCMFKKYIWRRVILEFESQLS